jgi:RNase P subunit RPR2
MPMLAQPISYVAFKFPAPVCDECRLPMLSVTTIYHRSKSQPAKVVSYWCQKCRSTLGWPRQRAKIEHFAPPFPGQPA